ncbi:glycosyltransferase [Microbacterium sp. ARD31]|uniref:glycosyltransferase n=1 Tax=Microbacterium sp. ARD31 TaxID=2962576 RepID=UPI0028826FC7|nr:glycosyltransferase [Microbacterium sp. ARD31]MDT0185738.1 glycosyltransferase [Microbacterium sp. ARD31]
MNTLSTADGGPARNSFELNMALNRDARVRAQLLWITGEHAGSVMSSHRGPHADVYPRQALNKESESRAHLFRDLRTADAIIVHGYYLWWVLPAVVLGRWRKVPVFLMPHGSLTAYQRQFSRLKKFIFECTSGWLIRRWVTTFVVGSSREADELREFVRKSPVIVSGVGTSVVPVARDRGWQYPPQLLMLGRIAAKKRVDLSIQALAWLIQNGHQAELTVAGAGPAQLRSELSHLASDLGVGERVAFVGEVVGAEKTELLERADIFLLPSDDENFGIAAAEALASGLPVVGSDAVAAIEGLPEIAGARLSQPDGSSLGSHLKRILDTDPRATREAAAAFAASRFSWEVVAARWIDAIAAEICSDVESRAERDADK